MKMRGSKRISLSLLALSLACSSVGALEVQSRMFLQGQTEPGSPSRKRARAASSLPADESEELEQSAKAQKGDGRLHFAVPKKGRLLEKVKELLKAIGLDYRKEERLDIADVTNDDMPVKLVFLPAKDIATYVAEGSVDLGITGEDIIAEKYGLSTAGGEDIINETYGTFLKLSFGKCKLAVEVPKDQTTKSLKDFAGKRIVTSFPNLAKQHFAAVEAELEAERGDGEKVVTSIKEVSGSVESAIQLGLADAVVDLVESGTSMRAAGLDILENEEEGIIMETESVLVSNKNTKDPDMVALIAKLTKRVQGYLDAEKFKMVMYNISKDKLEEAKKITPGKESPTIQALADGESFAISALVEKKQVPSIMDQLEEMGATSILAFKVDNSRM